MGKGIGLAGGYGAGGVKDALVELIAQKYLEQDRAMAAEDRRLNRDRQTRLDTQAAEDRAFTRKRLETQDTRTARMDDEAREGKLTKEGVELATLFPGKVVSGETLKRYPKFLHELIAAPKEERLASRSISGMAVAGDPSAGEIDITEHEAVAPDSYELQLPVSERMRLAAERNTAAETKREADERFRQEKLDRDTQHRERMAEIAAQRAAGRGGMTDTGQLNAIEKLNTKYQANTKAAREVQRQYGVMERGMAAYEKGLGKGTAEQSVVMAFNKILDPDSVVREGEYDRTSQGQSLINRMHALALKVPTGGQIAPAVLKDMATLAKTYRDQAAAHERRERKRIERMADHFGLPRELVLAADDDDNQVEDATTTGAPAANTAAPAASGFRIKSVRPVGR